MSPTQEFLGVQAVLYSWGLLLHKLELALKGVLLVFESLVLLCVEQPVLRAEKYSDKMHKQQLCALLPGHAESQRGVLSIETGN